MDLSPNAYSFRTKNFEVTLLIIYNITYPIVTKILVFSKYVQNKILHYYIVFDMDSKSYNELWYKQYWNKKNICLN